MCFNETKSKTVSIWAGGRKYPIFAYGDNHLIDLAAITDWIEGLFFGVRESIGDKGFRFEDAFRDYARSVGLEIVHNGEITWDDGSIREADAIIKVGDRAIIIECVAAERPVDFEIAEPRRFAKRQEILTEKADQARSLTEKLENQPLARNLDLSWAAELQWIVVSHLSEFLWVENFPCFVDGRQCILDPIAACKWLSDMQESHDGVVPI